MGPETFRYRPPRVEMPRTAWWCLDRGFGPVGRDAAAGDPTETLDWLARLGLAERVAVRCGPERLERELGSDTARHLVSAGHRVAARAILLRELAALVGARGKVLDIPVVLLKGVALLESGHTVYGSRPLADADVLVAPADARRLTDDLCRHGFVDSGVVGPRFHQPPLIHRDLGTLEVHTTVAGLAHEGSPLDAPTLIAQGLVSAAAEMPGVRLPAPEVLGLHALAHAIDQHGVAPATYPLLRALADLQDLFVTAPRAAAALEETAVEAAISARERRGAIDLLAHLIHSQRPAGGSDAGRLLAHAVAGVGDRRYRSRLRVRAVLASLGKGEWRKVAARVRAPKTLAAGAAGGEAR